MSDAWTSEGEKVIEDVVGKTIRRMRYVPDESSFPPPLIDTIEIEFTDDTSLVIHGGGDDCDDWIGHKLKSQGRA